MSFAFMHTYRLKNYITGEYLMVANEPNINTISHGRAIGTSPYYDESSQKWKVFLNHTGVTIRSDINFSFALDGNGNVERGCVVRHENDLLYGNKLVLEPVNQAMNLYRIRTKDYQYLTCDATLGFSMAAWEPKSDLSYGSTIRSIWKFERTTSSGSDYTYPTKSRLLTRRFSMESSIDWTRDGDHRGIDIRAEQYEVPGDPIYAFADGIVSTVKRNVDNEGFSVYINHNTFLDRYFYCQSRYMHLNEVPFVINGQHVKKGQMIGRMGNSGNALYVHLHFELVLKETSNPAGHQPDFGYNLKDFYSEVKAWENPETYLTNFNFIGSSGLPSGGSGLDFSSPMPSYAPITQYYSSSHRALDYDGAIGDPVKSIGYGKVVYIHNWQGATSGTSLDTLGNTVYIEHYNSDGTPCAVSSYAHLNSISVSVGSIVSKGGVIGTIGNTGLSIALGGGDGSHLHFELRLGSSFDKSSHYNLYISGNRDDPLDYFQLN